MSNRKVDHNGYVRVEGNPISKVGVYDYLGSSLGSDFIPDKVYKVYRPEEALNNQETIDSFKNIPWIDDHEMLGRSVDGLTPAERKGIHGTTGENVYFEYPYLKANLNIYSEHLDDIIEDGKKELSPGYRCKYIKKSGTFQGESYDVVQTNILGNHLATVHEGRTGPDVAVLDHSFTFDSKDLVMDPKKKDAVALDEGMQKAMMDAMQDAMPKMMDAMMKDMMPKMMEDAMKPMMEGMMKDAMYGKDGEDPEKAEDEEEKGEGMDSKSVQLLVSKAIEKSLPDAISVAIDSAMKPVLDKQKEVANAEAKSALVEKASAVLGTFDHADKTLEQVQDYVLESVGLDGKDKTSSEKSLMCDVYLNTHKPGISAPVSTGQDSKDGKVDFRKYKKESN